MVSGVIAWVGWKLRRARRVGKHASGAERETFIGRGSATHEGALVDPVTATRSRPTRREAESACLRADIDATHQRLEGLLGELDRRRREAFDVRLQMRRHPVASPRSLRRSRWARCGGGTTLAVDALASKVVVSQHSPAARLSRLWQISGHCGAKAGDRLGMLGSVATRAAQVATAMLVRRLVSRVRWAPRARLIAPPLAATSGHRHRHQGGGLAIAP